MISKILQILILQPRICKKIFSITRTIFSHRTKQFWEQNTIFKLQRLHTILVCNLQLFDLQCALWDSTSQLVLTELRTSLALFSTPFLQELWHWDLLPTNNTILVNMSFAHSPSARIWQNLFPTVWAKGDSYDEGCWKLDLISRCSLISKFEMCALQLFLF